MAAGNTLAVFGPLANQPPASGFATLDTRNSHVVLSFPDTGNADAIFGGFLPRNYTNGGVQVTLVWMAASVTTGDAVWEVYFERHVGASASFDADVDDFTASPQTGTATTAAASGRVQYTTISFTDGAQMDSLVAGESFRLRVRRTPGAAGDTLGDTAQLLRVEVRETP